MRVFLVLLAAVIAQSLFSQADGWDAPNTPPAGFKITTKRADDAVVVQSDQGRTVVTVKSPFGISQAVLEPLGNTWPEALVLRLHLKGLASFRASNGTVTLAAALSLQEGRTTVRIWKDGEENSPLDEQSPFWMDIHIGGDDGRPAQELPLKDGYFEMTLPKVFFHGSPKSITLNWIDFNRQ